jgi:hypothetical protein
LIDRGKKGQKRTFFKNKVLTFHLTFNFSPSFSFNHKKLNQIIFCKTQRGDFFFETMIAKKNETKNK